MISPVIAIIAHLDTKGDEQEAAAPADQTLTATQVPATAVQDGDIVVSMGAEPEEEEPAGITQGWFL